MPETEVSLTPDDFILTPNFTAEDYEKTWSDRLSDLSDEPDERNKVLQKFYKYVWDLLFGPEATESTHARAIALLVVQRPDACFFNPFDYNDWIRTVKTEIIKQGMGDLWEKEFRQKQLGLIWARDSDYFDDMEDPEPGLFYKLKETDAPFVWK